MSALIKAQQFYFVCVMEWKVEISGGKTNAHITINLGGNNDQQLDSVIIAGRVAG